MTDSQKWLIIFSVLITGLLVYLLSPVITPFLISAIIAYLFDPLVDKLEKRFSRTIAVLIIFAFIILLVMALFFVLVPVLQSELISLIQRIPDFVNWLERELLPRLSSMLGIDIKDIDIDTIRNSLQDNWRNIGNFAEFLFVHITSSGQALITLIAYLLLIPVVSFYLLRDWDMIVRNVKTVLPVRSEKTISGLVLECDGVLSEFLRGQLLVMLFLSIIYACGLWLAGIEYAFLIGFAAGLISFVPYLGSIVGIGVAGIVAFFQYHDLLHILYVAVVFGVGQVIEGMLLSPMLVGDRIGLHPVAVIFAVMAGGQLFGFTGILLALPIAAVCLVLLRFAFESYKSSELYSQ